jgi:hypothetical protein
MKEIPARLQCAYCLRNQRHGGECRRDKFDDIGCLAFQSDPKGCIRNNDLRIEVPLYYDIPPLKTWWPDWELRGVDTEIRVNWIRGISWNARKGSLILHCDCDYYVNEFGEDYKDPKSKPVLKIVK